MGTGVMIGAGIFALTGQIAELAGPLFPIIHRRRACHVACRIQLHQDVEPLAFIRRHRDDPPKAYGPGVVAASASLLMALSMVIDESLVAGTFATYALRPFELEQNGLLVSVLALGLIVFAYLVNAAGNGSVSGFSLVMSAIKIGGIAVPFCYSCNLGQRLCLGRVQQPTTTSSGEALLASVAFSILAFKGFTTITNSGGEIVDPHRNVGRTIMISIAVCVVVYLLVAVAVGSSLSIAQIVEARDYSLAAAAEPALGDLGFYFASQSRSPLRLLVSSPAFSPCHEC